MVVVVVHTPPVHPAGEALLDLPPGLDAVGLDAYPSPSCSTPSEASLPEEVLEVAADRAASPLADHTSSGQTDAEETSSPTPGDYQLLCDQLPASSGDVRRDALVFYTFHAVGEMWVKGYVEPSAEVKFINMGGGYSAVLGSAPDVEKLVGTLSAVHPRNAGERGWYPVTADALKESSVFVRWGTTGDQLESYPVMWRSRVSPSSSPVPVEVECADAEPPADGGHCHPDRALVFEDESATDPGEAAASPEDDKRSTPSPPPAKQGKKRQRASTGVLEAQWKKWSSAFDQEPVDLLEEERRRERQTHHRSSRHSGKKR